MAKIKSYKFVGEQQTYDIEVEHKDHQFFLENGALSSNSHSVSYAIDSYYAGWLYTYYPHEWIATVLQSETMGGSKDKLAKVIGEAKALGYKIIPPDVNTSELEWHYSKEKKGFVAPLPAIKKVGLTAAKEIIKHRPYNNLHDLLYDELGLWYHSKMNKSVFASLCKIEAFNSLEEIKTGKIKNHAQLYDIIIENYDKLRKGRKGMTPTQVKRLEKKGEFVNDILDILIEKTGDVEDWPRSVKIEHSYELMNHVDNDLLFPEKVLKSLKEYGVKPFTTLLNSRKKDLVWFFVELVQKKKTKNGKTFYRIKGIDDNNNTAWLRIWGSLKNDIEPYSLWMCEGKGDPDWGPSTSAAKIKRINLEKDDD